MTSTLEELEKARKWEENCRAMFHEVICYGGSPVNSYSRVLSCACNGPWMDAYWLPGNLEFILERFVELKRAAVELSKEDKGAADTRASD